MKHHQTMLGFLAAFNAIILFVIVFWAIILIKSSRETTNGEKIDIVLLHAQIHEKFATDAKSVEDSNILKSDILKLLHLEDVSYELVKHQRESIFAMLKGGTILSIVNLLLLGYIYIKPCTEKP